MSLYEEFRDIAINGNAARRAERASTVAASSIIVTSLVDGVMPVIGLILDQLDLSDKFVGLGNPNSVAVPSLAASRRPGARRLLSVCSSMLL